MSIANYITAADTFDDWRDSIFTGKAPTLYRMGEGELGQIEIGPKLVTLFGGAPGAGKTAFSMQLVVDGLRLNPDLRAAVCNIEMSADVLMDRQLARVSGLNAADIRYRRFDETHMQRLDMGLSTLETIVDRLCFLKPPFTLQNVADTADDFDAKLILLDYIQRISPPGNHGDKRGSVDATMNYLRQFADVGVAVVVVAAVSRQKDTKGRSTYSGDSLSLASFRESSELEFGADDAFILVPCEKSEGMVTLKHLKARHTEPRDIQLRFDRKRQSFTTDDAPQVQKPDSRAQLKLAALWKDATPADEGSN